jgi:hypothetical protein
MRRAVSIAIAAGLLPLQASSQPADAAPADPVVVRVGASEVRASELGYYLGQLHPFERESFGHTPDAVRQAYVARRLVPELLLAEQARALGLAAQPDVAQRLDRTLTEALKLHVQRAIDAKLTERELRDYCKSGGDKTGADCERDASSYRIALRRIKAHAELEARARKLEALHLRRVDRSLLDRLSVGPDGAISALPPATAERRQPE